MRNTAAESCTAIASSLTIRMMKAGVSTMRDAVMMLGGLKSGFIARQSYASCAEAARFALCDYVFFSFLCVMRSPLLVLALMASAIVASCGGSSTTTRTDAGADSVPAPAGRTSTIPGYTEYYRVMRYNGLDQIVFCYPTNDPKSEPDVYAVARDINGRPTTITRYFFGNPETRVEWTTMRIAYNYYPSTAQMVERRTYHDVAGGPIAVRGGYGVEVMYKGGQLTMRRLIDQNDKPVMNTPIVVRSFFKEERPGTIVQEWFFGNGKQYFGIGNDQPGTPFGDMPPPAYFRRYSVNARGDVVREEVWGIEKTAIPYPGGELVRAYELDECGMPIAITYLDESGRARPNADGIARETRRYDDFGRLTEWQAFNERGTPQARRDDGAAAMRLRYRAFDGVLIGIERFDEQGNVIATDTATARR
jgi:hypothetical protein